MLPPHEGFETDDRPAVEGDDRLVVQDQIFQARLRLDLLTDEGAALRGVLDRVA